MTWPKNGLIWSNISESTGPIFAIFTPYESALRADDGSVAYLARSANLPEGLYIFFQFVKGHCHGNQIMLRKCINVD